ncbi:MAG: hypothetical protein A3I60_00405 [Sulfuricurvum sp. RIFCSPLOWO2_02_FULL_43_45]|nr:MAG: hypothetical protein A3I60_00405 [Sulfuricurvum sp. RIFCSPLOWO2_02_FULL_43_45]
MKKSLILASLLFSLSHAGIYPVSGSSTCKQATLVKLSCTASNIEQYGWVYGQLKYTGAQCGGTTGYYAYMTNSFLYIASSPVDVACPNCNGGTWNGATQSCTMPPLSAYNNDVDACHAHDGLLKADGSCVSYGDFGAYLLTEPTAFLGGGLFINGYMFTAAGLVGGTLLGPATAAGAAFATIGGIAMVAGVGIALYGAGDDIAANFAGTPDKLRPPTNDTTLPDRMRIKLREDSEGGQTVTNADTSSGKIDKISHIPPEVRQRILDGVVNPTTGEPNITPSDLAGTTTTSYNYTNNTATTETMKSDGTTVTSTTPFTPITNPDGTVTAKSHNEAVAPTVTGTKGTTIDVPEWNQYQIIAQWTEKNAQNAGTTSGGGSTGSTPVSTGDATADAIANADMPAYTLGDTGNFDTLDKTVVTDMSTSANSFLDNVQNQIDAAKTVYDQTSALVSGGWQTPVIPAGECGNGMAMDFHGQHVDLCPSIANFLAPISPLVSFLFTLAGTAFAIAIFLGGF